MQTSQNSTAFFFLPRKRVLFLFHQPFARISQFLPMASIRIASIQKKPAGFVFGTTFEDHRITDHSFCLLQNGVTFSVCLIFNLQIFGLSDIFRQRLHLTSWHGVETTQTSGMHLKKTLSHFQNGQQKKWAPKQSPPKKLSPKTTFFLVKTSKKKSNSSQQIRCWNLPGGNLDCTTPAEEIKRSFGPAQTGRQVGSLTNLPAHPMGGNVETF